MNSSVSSLHGIKAQLLRSGAGSIAVKVGNMLLGLVLAIILARTLGPEQYGVYAYVLVIITMLAMPAGFGLPNLIVRETAKAQAHEQWGVMLGVWRWSTLFSIKLTMVLALVAVIVVVVFEDFFSPFQRLTLYWGVALLPFITLGQLRSAALRGLRRVVQGQLPDTIIRPSIFIVLIGGIIWLDMGLTASEVMALHVLAAALAFGAGAWMLLRAQPSELKNLLPVVSNSRKWLASSLPFALIGGMRLINQHTDIIMLGWFASAADVGVYHIVVQGGTLVIFGLTAINMTLAPYFSKMYVKNELESLQRLVTISARIILLVTVPVVFVFVLYGQQFLELVFGEEYAYGSTALAIMSIAQLFNASFGSVGLLLNMTGHEKQVAQGVAFAAVLNIVLNVLLIPLLGIEGAAIATAVTFFTWNVLLWRAVIKYVGVDTLAMPITRRLKAEIDKTDNLF